MGELDKKDRLILNELDINARASDTEIAKKVRLPKETVRYRIQKLLDEGYINYFMTLINTAKLGYDWYRTFFKFQSLTLEKEEEIINWLKEKSSWITKVEGKWDLNTGIFCKTIYEYRDIINEFTEKYNEYIERYEPSIITRMWIHHKNYLIEKKQQIKPVFFGFDRKEDRVVESIDDIDKKIIKILLKNAREKTIDIARKINNTEMVVRYRIKNLIDKKIIIGFRPFININKLGYIYFKVHIRLKNFTKEDKSRMYEYLFNHPNAAHTTELVGGSDIETEFQVESNEVLYNIIEELRKQFNHVIRDYEFMQYTDEYKFTYFPEM